MGTSAPENGIYGISGLWDLGIMGFVICGILVLWEKEGEEGRSREERRVGQEPWSISAGVCKFFVRFYSLVCEHCGASQEAEIGEEDLRGGLGVFRGEESVRNAQGGVVKHASPP